MGLCTSPQSLARQVDIVKSQHREFPLSLRCDTVRRETPVGHLLTEPAERVHLGTALRVGDHIYEAGGRHVPAAECKELSSHPHSLSSCCTRYSVAQPRSASMARSKRIAVRRSRESVRH